MLWKCSVWTSPFMSKLAPQVLLPVGPAYFVGARLPANWPVWPVEMQRLEVSLRGQARSYGICV